MLMMIWMASILLEVTMMSNSIKLLVYSKCKHCEGYISKMEPHFTGDKVGYIRHYQNGSNFHFSARVGKIETIIDKDEYVKIVYRKKSTLVNVKNLSSTKGFNSLSVSMGKLCSCHYCNDELCEDQGCPNHYAGGNSND